MIHFGDDVINGVIFTFVKSLVMLLLQYLTNKLVKFNNKKYIARTVLSSLAIEIFNWVRIDQDHCKFRNSTQVYRGRLLLHLLGDMFIIHTFDGFNLPT